MQRRDLLKLSLSLMGAASSASVSRALLAGTLGAPGKESTVFTSEQRPAVKLLADMIIPPTDTPGAVDAGVHHFIESIVSEWYTDRERDIFLQGLEALDGYCLKHGGVPFHQAGEASRIAALRDQERIAGDYQAPVPKRTISRPKDDENAPFFTKIKELVVLGYYTSEVGATQELSYVPVPGTYDGDHDFNEIGRQWSH